MPGNLSWEYWQIPRYWLDAGASGHICPKWSPQSPGEKPESTSRGREVVNVTKTYALPRERLYLPDSLIATWFTVHSNIQHWMTDCPARVYDCCRGTLCVLSYQSEKEREMRVCLYWHSKVTAPSSAILSRTVNHWTDDLDAPVLWGAKHAHEWRHTLTHSTQTITCLTVWRIFLFFQLNATKNNKHKKGIINISKLILWLWKQSWSLTCVYISLQWITAGHLWAEICSR